MKGDDQVEAALLEALGADRPLWKRRWVPEQDLASSRRERDQVAEVLERLARAQGVLLHMRRTPRGRYWMLERLPRPRSVDEPVGENSPADLPDSLVANHGGPTVSTLAKKAANQRVGPPPIRANAEGPRAEVDQSSAISPGGPSEVAAPDVIRLRRILRNFGVEIEDIDRNVQIGPSVRRYRILLSPGSRLAALRGRTEDISRELGIETDLFISNVPGDRYVALDLPRSDRQVVPFAPALATLPPPDGISLWLAMGVTPAGEPVGLDLVTLPHLLVAGAPGSGKSAWLQTALLSLALRLSDEELEIVIIDPKGVDFQTFGRLPHTRGGDIITEPDEAIDVLRGIATQELPERTRALQDAKHANMRDLRSTGIGGKYMVVVIDEFAEIVTVLSKAERAEFEREVLRLAQRARAAGIHLIVATQRPTTDLITGAIKVNLPTRVSFRVPQRIDSMVILDQPGAETLLGAGDMLLSHGGKLQRLQGYFSPMNEIAELITARVAPLKGRNQHA